MYILIVSRGYPSDKYKMHGIFEFDQAKALIKAGHKVIYLVVDMRSIRRTRKWGFESLEKEGVKIEAINIPCGRIPADWLNRVSIIAFKHLYKKINNKYGQPDIIHAHFINSGYWVAKSFDDSKIPLILTEHFSGINQKQISPKLLKIGSYTYPRMNKVIAVSSHLAKNIKEKFHIESVIIPNIVDTNNFSYKASMKENRENFNFVSTGSLVPNKRMDLLIKAFHKTFHKNKKVNLYIFGEGFERRKLEKLISELGMKEQIFLKGLVDREAIAKTMNESDCFVLASQLETFGVACIEAMAAGLPIIATKCGGPEDFITNLNGLLVPVDKVNDLANALDYMYNNISCYDNELISKLSRDKFSSSSIARRLTEVYEEIIANL